MKEYNLKNLPQATPYKLTTIADTSAQFSDFSPFVASANDEGSVAFQAALRDGGTGVFTCTGGAISLVADTSGGFFSSFRSHPDIDRNGSVAFYADLNSGDQGIFLIKNGRPVDRPGRHRWRLHKHRSVGANHE